MRTRNALGILLLLGLTGCSDEGTNFHLSGTWVDTESSGLQFIEFYGKNKGRLGLYAKNHEQYEEFSYRLFDNKIALHFAGSHAGETIHDLTFIDNDRISISDLTVIPENPLKIYQRASIKSEKENNEVVLGVDDLYFDFETGIRLQACPINESRCPAGANCVWQGYAAARFHLIVDGNTAHIFDLATIDSSPELRRDTLIGGMTYRLLDITPYPDLEKEYNIKDYKVIVSIHK